MILQKVVAWLILLQTHKLLAILVNGNGYNIAAHTVWLTYCCLKMKALRICMNKLYVAQNGILQKLHGNHLTEHLLLDVT